MKEIISNIGVWILIFGTLCANIPQYIRLYRRKNVQGINETMLIIGTLGCITSVCGDILDNKDKLISYCSEGGYDCYMNVVGLIQLTCPYIIAYIFYIMYFYYSDCNVDISIKTRFVWVVLANLFMAIGTVISFFIFDMSINHKINIFLNILSSIFSIVMWFPQILETYRQKGNYSLSTLSIFIHSLGCLATVIYQSFFNSQSLFVIVPYALASILEFTLFCLCIYYKYSKVQKRELYEPLNKNDNSSQKI